MDDAHFDAWTRRRFGLTSGGLMASLVGLAAGGDDAAAKRKRKKCKSNEKRCGKKKCVEGDCCPEKPCGENCECRRTVGGRTFCVDLGFKIACIQCTSDADCDKPRRCTEIEGCIGDVTAVCQLPCGFDE